MKRFFKVLEYLILIAVSLAAFWAVTKHSSSFLGHYFLKDYELMCYGIWGICLAVVFYHVSDKLKVTWNKITAGAVVSAIYTLLVFFANNFWRYISINNTFNDEIFVPYTAVLKWDITYTEGLGEFRYFAVFLLMYALCGLIIALSHSKTKDVFTRVKDNFYNWLLVEE